MMICLIFHTAIIINRKNCRVTIKLHFENLSIFFKKKRRYTRARTPFPLFVFVCFSMIPLSPPQRTYFLNDPKGNLFSHVLIDINKRTNFCVVIHAQTNFAQAKYFMLKAICLSIGPMMGSPLFPLV